MNNYYDDNFGHWDEMENPEMRNFYRNVQKKSIKKICVDCKREVKILPDYECCDQCATRREQGGY
jgi:hypothetical protein